MQSLSFRCRSANWSGFIRAYIDKPGRRPMTVPRPPTTGRPVEAAADRVMLLWSLIKMVPDHELTLLRSSLLEKLSEQQHLAEDELVIAGLKYLHQNVRWKRQK